MPQDISTIFLRYFRDIAVVCQVLKVALATNNAVVANGANITVAGLQIMVTPLNGYSAPHTGNIVRIYLFTIINLSFLLSYFYYQSKAKHTPPTRLNCRVESRPRRRRRCVLGLSHKNYRITYVIKRRRA